ncbi:DNA (cytosine-5-)-methyltransferase [Brevibacillus nitrificans]|uniref:DNA (cytosine-5-)-methyltransferase n=1 Tax=Brevibacillus nitrificans TaxID=651560 RepID=UPI002860D1C6|nr:DNA (cytosine-5-)-methyltransferase [Brevibacillus nitrificans]MDR7316060.1 DNA (cytosine-5)-methyltransferase 1 [Brevibacillus nitrificans]
MNKQFHIKVDEELHKQVRVHAASEGMSIQDYVLLALNSKIRESKTSKATVGKNKFTFIDLFAGIGGMRLGFEKAGGRCVFTSEWDKYAQKTYFSNFGDMPEGDITKIHEKEIPPHDILVAGFPCQPFSIAGVSKKNSLGRTHGFLDETQGTLFFDVARIIKEKRPKAFLLENVKNLKSHDKGRTFKIITKTLEELNYNIHVEVLDGKNFVPQHRERIFIVGFDKDIYKGQEFFTFPDMPVQKMRIKDILEKEVDPKYTLSDKLWAYLQNYAEKHKAKGNGFGYGLVDLDGTSRTLSARYYKDGSEILIPQGENVNPRKLTPRECARLQGFPESFKIVVSDTQAYKQFGNSVVAPLIEAIAKQITQALESFSVKDKKEVS